jgi:hypothetical protein
MKKATFYLVATVIATQLLIVSGVLIGCFRTGNGKCTGEKAGELMMYITTQSFALYAAEK